MSRASAAATKLHEDDRERDDSGVRVIPVIGIDEDERQAIERITSSDLVAFLFECIKGALFVLDADDNVVAMNKAGRSLARRAGADVVQMVVSHRDTIVDTAVGPLRVVRREVATTEKTHHLVMLAEPFAIDATELLRVATAKWKPTQRQGEVLKYVLEGLSNKEIAEEINVSPRTVEVHVTALLDKAGVDSRSRLIARARELAAHEYMSR